MEADLRAIHMLLGHATIMTAEIYTYVGTKKLKTVHSNMSSAGGALIYGACGPDGFRNSGDGTWTRATGPADPDG
jgi:hypothetical protein